MILLATQEELQKAKCKEGILCECEFCHKPFLNPKNIVLRALKGSNKGRYCSRKCSDDAKKPEIESVTCLSCGKPFQANVIEQRKFCDHSCAAKITNVARAKKRKCANCGNEIKAGKYCSHDCNKQHKWKLKKAEIEESGELPSAHSRKRYLLELFGNKCSICKIEEWMGKPVPLVMDHIDGNPSNNSISNFRFVCGNCDMQLPTYKAKNRGKGRAFRRKRYAEGKSY